jgi:hypothetical protein
MTKIATGGVNVNSRGYLAYMSVRHWGLPGHWTTNYAGIATSDDNGQTWTEVPGARRDNTADRGDKFQMVSFARLDNYVYLFGTPNGRFGNTYLARVPDNKLTTPADYQYWTGTGGWRTGTDRIASPILPGPVGEISSRRGPRRAQPLPPSHPSDHLPRCGGQRGEPGQRREGDRTVHLGRDAGGEHDYRRAGTW